MRDRLRSLLLAIGVVGYMGGCIPPAPVRIVDNMEHANWFYSNAQPGVTTEADLKYHMSPATVWYEKRDRDIIVHHNAGYKLESESQSTMGTIRIYSIIIPEGGAYETDKMLYMVTFYDGKLQSMTRVNY